MYFRYSYTASPSPALTANADTFDAFSAEKAEEEEEDDDDDDDDDEEEEEEDEGSLLEMPPAGRPIQVRIYMNRDVHVYGCTDTHV